jgi:hypothetical protein
MGRDDVGPCERQAARRPDAVIESGAGVPPPQRASVRAGDPGLERAEASRLVGAASGLVSEAARGKRAREAPVVAPYAGAAKIGSIRNGRECA